MGANLFRLVLPMKNVLVPVIAFSAILLPSLYSAEADFTDRKVTDPLLKVSSLSSLLPEKDSQWLGGVRDEKHVPPVYKRLWNERDVIMLEPLSRERPAQIDFSAVTESNKGVLRLKVRNDPRGDFELEILKNGQTFKKETIGSGKWERYTIPFDHEPVIVKNRANGWSFEFGYFDYTFAKQP